MSAVDIVVPCYNYGRYLKRCISSLIHQQDGVDVRVLIIDDCSSDNTEEVGQELAKSDSRVEFRRHEVNLGHIATYNEGLLKWASAEYSLLISADDMLAPQALARATYLMDRHPDVGMAYGMALYIVEDNDLCLELSAARSDYRIIPGNEFLCRFFEHGNFVPTPTAVVRTSMQQELGGYSIDLPHAGDMEMWMRFGVHGPVAVLMAVQAYYRWHGNNMSYAYYRQQLRHLRQIEQACMQITEHWSDKLLECEKWLSAMNERLGQEAFWLAGEAVDKGDLETYRAASKASITYTPAIGRSGKWWKLRAKALMGPTLWTKMMPVLDRLRGLPPREEQNWVPPQHGAEFGWWPESQI